MHGIDPAIAGQVRRWREDLAQQPGEVFEQTGQWLDAHLEADPAARHAVMLAAGLAAARLSRNQRAVALLEAVLPHLPEAADDASASDLCAANRALGSAYSELGQHARASAHYERALTVARAFAMAFEQAACLNNIGNLLQMTGDEPAALATYRDALEIFRRINHEMGTLILLSNVAALLKSLGDAEAALAYFSESAQLARQLGDERGVAIALHNAGGLLIDLQRFSEAQVDLSGAVEAFRRSGSPAELLLATGTLARACHACGDNGRAGELLAELSTALEAGPGDDERLHVGAIGEFTNLLKRIEPDNHAGIDYWLQRGCELARANGLRREVIEFLEERARLAETRMNWQLAASLLRELLAAEREFHVERSEETLRKHQVALEVDRLRATAEQERAHAAALKAVNLDLARSRDEAARQAQRAREASEAKGRFLSVMSHELRTPVNAIHGCARLLAQPLPEARRHACLDVVQSAAESLLSLVNHQLDLAKIESGKVRVECAPFDLSKELRAALLAVAPAAANKRLLLLPCYGRNSPAAQGQFPFPLQAVGDGFRLRQVLINLLSNAVRFTEVGWIRLEVDFVSSTRHWEFRVRDTGPGMMAAQCRKVFDAFEQADGSTEAQYGGTGLGLTICDQLARLMGGNISVSSTPGEGTTFLLRIPQQGMGPDCTGLPLQAPLPDAAPMRIHLLTREPALADWLAEVVSAAGFTLVADAMSADCVLAESGCEVPCLAAQRLLRMDPCAFAGATVNDTNGTDSSAGAATILPLPILPEDLIAAIHGRECAVQDSLPLPDGTFAQKFPLRILMVEDDPASRSMLAELLGHLGYQPDVAEHGRTALARMSGTAYDLILTDLHMPELDGESLAAAVRRLPSANRPRIVAASATRRLDYAARHAFDGFLPKPILPEQLMSLLQRVAEHADIAHEGGANLDAPADHVAFFDAAHWSHLCQFLPVERLQELLSMALADLSRLLDQLDAAAAVDDRKALVAGLHRVAGIAAHYGLRAVEEAACRLEADARNQARPDAFLRDLQTLRQLFEKSVAEASVLKLSINPDV